MRVWTEECESCGYVARDIGEASETVKQVVLSPAYKKLWQRDVRKAELSKGDGEEPLQKLLSNTYWKHVSLIGRYERATLLAVALGDRADTAKQALRAAWAADDEADEAARRMHREQAVTHTHAILRN